MTASSAAPASATILKLVAVVCSSRLASETVSSAAAASSAALCLVAAVCLFRLASQHQLLLQMSSCPAEGWHPCRRATNILSDSGCSSSDSGGVVVVVVVVVAVAL
jgi:hypothetical protein